MCKVIGCLLIGLLANVCIAVGQGADVTKLLTDARDALGSREKLTALQTFTGTGRTTRAIGQRQVSSEFELAFETPNKYLFTEKIAAGTAQTTRTSGFNADELIFLNEFTASGTVLRSGPNGPASQNGSIEQRPERTKAALLSTKQEFARMMLGIFGTAFPAYPLEFASIGQAESTDGRADIVEARGDSNFVARLFLDSRAHFPLMLSWQAPDVQIRSLSPQGGVIPATRDRPDEVRLVEHRLYFSDRRDVTGIKLPFKVARSVNGQTTEETIFDGFKINMKINPSTFQIPK